MTMNGEDYEAALPNPPPDNSQIDYYIVAVDGIGLSSMVPDGAPAEVYTIYFTEVVYAYAAEDPDDPDWQLGVPGDVADSGVWVRADPVGTDYYGLNVQPEDDHTPAPGVKCYVTGNGSPGGAAGDNDVDHGCTTLMSPVFALAGHEKAFVEYWRWFGEGGNAIDDDFVVEVSADGGTSWVELERVVNNANSWQLVQADLTPLIALTDQVVFRFLACDENSQGLVEVAIDDLSVQVWSPAITAVEPEEGTPERPVFSLAQNHPNPFNPVTKIRFSLPRADRVELAVYAVDGHKVATLLAEEMPAGAHEVVWNGKDTRGQAVASGTYFYQLVAGENVMTRRMVLVK